MKTKGGQQAAGISVAALCDYQHKDRPKDYQYKTFRLEPVNPRQIITPYIERAQSFVDELNEMTKRRFRFHNRNRGPVTAFEDRFGRIVSQDKERFYETVLWHMSHLPISHKDIQKDDHDQDTPGQWRLRALSYTPWQILCVREGNLAEVDISVSLHLVVT